MTLSDALVLMAPSDSTLSETEATQRDDAIVLVYGALGRLARRVVREPLRDEVVQKLIIHLMKARPGNRRYTATDSEAEAYLLRSLRNKVTDLHRRAQRDQARLVSIDAGDEGKPLHQPRDPETPETRALIEERVQLGVEARAVLFEQAVPAIARTLQHPDGFQANVADLRAIATGELTVDAIVAREGGEGPTFVKVRNRVYQRHKRTRAYLLEVPRNKPDDLARLTAWLGAAQLPAALEAEVRRLAALIFAPRVERGDATPDSQEQDS
jgi:DNA-directed RNA polymerase specialized sigma24 family protein